MVSQLNTSANLTPDTRSLDTRSLDTRSLDTRSLELLRVQARQSPDQALKAAAQQFESVFLNMMLKSMREATPQDDMFGSEQTRMFTGMLDQQLAQSMSSRGIGLADIMVRQLRGQMKENLPPILESVDNHAPDSTVSGGLPPAGVPAALSGLPRERPLAAPSALHSSPSGEQRISPDNYQQTLAPLSRSPLSPTFNLPVKILPSAHNETVQQSFINRMLPHAMQASQTTGVPPQLILGQAALESGWGRHEIRMADGNNSYNLFGIKAHANWHGKTAEVLTTEYTNGVAHKQIEKFRAYTSYAEAFQDYANMIGRNPRYADVLQQGGDVAGMAQVIHKAGYATDPKYADKLARVMGIIKMPA